MLRKTMLVLGALAGLAAPAAAAGYAWHHVRHRARIAAEVEALPPPLYGAQKVVYHLTDDDGVFAHRYRSRIGTLKNHLKAVGRDRLEIRVVLQGPGVGLLHAALADAGLRGDIDALRAAGVRFLVCRNSLVEQDMAPSDLYGVTPDDFAGSAVAELAALQAQGFAYLRL